jgi:hypothetical protein
MPGVSNQADDEVAEEVTQAAMARALNLRDILELGDDGLGDGLDDGLIVSVNTNTNTISTTKILLDTERDACDLQCRLHCRRSARGACVALCSEFFCFGSVREVYGAGRVNQPTNA